MKNRAVLSLHRALLRALVLVAGVLVLFLAVLDAYWILNYQETLRTQWKDLLTPYAEGVKQDLDIISSDLYDIYYYDDNYRKLSTAKSIEAYPYIHELEERLRTLQVLKRRAAGYVIYYDGLGSKRYYFTPGDFTNADVEELKEVSAGLASADNALRGWYYYTVNRKAYAICIYRNNGVALEEIYCLENVKQELEKELADVHAGAFLEYRAEILGNEEEAENYREFAGQNNTVVRGSYVCRKQIAGTDLTLYLVIPMSFLAYMNVPQAMILLLTLLVILFAMLFYFRLRRELFLPLDDLMAEMKRIGGGDWESGIHTQSRFQEIQQVIETTGRMIDEIEAQKLLAYEKTIQEQKARFQYLSLQLNPHFYLNGLKTLNYLAMNGENERIQEIIIRFSGYLRYLLQMEKDMVTLSEEVEFTRNYVDLYREMTDRRIEAEWRIPEDTRQCMVPRLCIQTFVENCVKYARLGKAEYPLEIQISSARFSSEEGEFLEVIVQDNGKGYSDELLEVLNNAPEEGSVSVGINNLKRRCELLYDRPVEYAFYNGEGAVSDVFYPWMKAEEGGSHESAHCG